MRDCIFCSAKFFRLPYTDERRMRKIRRSMTITLLASATAALTLVACDYNRPDGARYSNYQECIQEWSQDYCEDGRDGYYYSHFYYSGGHVYGFNSRTKGYSLVPNSAGIYRNPGMAPSRASSVRTGGFGTSARGVSVGG